MARKVRERWSEEKGRGEVLAFEASGLSMAAFARRQGVSLSKLKYWRKKVTADPVSAVVPTRFVELVSATSGRQMNARHDSAAPNDRLVLQGPLGWVLEVPPDHLDGLIRSLAAVSAC